MRGRGASKQNPGLQDNDDIELSQDEHSDNDTECPDAADQDSREQTKDDTPTTQRTSDSKKRPADDTVENLRRSKRRKIDPADAKEATLGDYEKVRLICRPWRKPEGHLNRSTFSSMLETILLFVMSNPACIRKAVEDRFSPYLKPVAVLELLEILEQLGCLNKIIYRKTSSKTSLFSKPSTYEKVDEESEGDMVMYESTPDCCLKFGQFSFFLSALN